MTNYPKPEPVQVTIQRGKQGSYIRTEQLLCPACGHYTRHEWEQPPVGRSPARTETHCINPDCEAYYRTLDERDFMLRFGSDHQLDLIQYLYPWLDREGAYQLYRQPANRTFIDLAVRCLAHVDGPHGERMG